MLPLSETDRAYLAGLLDGEGCFVADANYSIQINVSQAPQNKVLLDWLVERFGHPPSDWTNRGKVYWQWNVYGSTARAVIEAALPYLVLKKTQAELLLIVDDLRRRRKAEGRACFSEQERLTLYVIQQRLTDAKRKQQPQA